MSFYENLKFIMIKNFEEYKSHYNESIENPEKYWKEYASSFNWIKKPTKVLSWNFDDPKVENALKESLNDRDWQVRQIAEDLLDSKRVIIPVEIGPRSS